MLANFTSQNSKRKREIKKAQRRNNAPTVHPLREEEEEGEQEEVERTSREEGGPEEVRKLAEEEDTGEGGSVMEGGPD